jgi:hypothetical protein
VTTSPLIIWFACAGIHFTSAEHMHTKTFATADDNHLVDETQDTASKFAAELTRAQFSDRNCDPFCHPINCSHTWQLAGGAEFVHSKPRFEDGAEKDSADNTFDFQLVPSARVWLDVISPTQIHFLARYWSYSDDTPATPAQHAPLAGNQFFMSLDAYTIDMEIGQQLDFGLWKTVISAGVRNAWFDQAVISLDTGNEVSRRLHTIGPLIGADIRRQLFWGFETVSVARMSLLVGESLWNNAAGQTDTDDIGSIFDLQIGLAWKKEFCRLGELSLRAVWEHQFWFGAGSYFQSTATIGNGVFDIQPDDHDVAFMGYALAVELRR